MSPAGVRAGSPGGRHQLALVDDAAPAEPSVPGPRRPPPGELRVVPELGEPGRELDTWRISGREARVLTPFWATACTGNAGLCGVCTGGPCAHDLEQDHETEHETEHEQEQDHTDEEIEL